MKIKTICIIILMLVFVVKGGEVMALEIKSSAFRNGDFIPARYSGKGENISPPLGWSGVPAKTQSFAIISDDPDAPSGLWVHWVLYDIPGDKRSLPEGIKKDKILSDGSKQGMTNFGDTGYGGPYPPPGMAHRYFFKIYALDCKLNLMPGITREELLKEMKGHIIAEAHLMGRFRR